MFVVSLLSFPEVLRVPALTNGFLETVPSGEKEEVEDGVMAVSSGVVLLWFAPLLWLYIEVLSLKQILGVITIPELLTAYFTG